MWKEGYMGDVGSAMLATIGESANTYAIDMCWDYSIFTADPKVVREIVVDDFENYIKGT